MPLRPLNIGDVLDGMFRLFLRHWRQYVLAVAVVLVPLNLVTSWLQRDLVAGVGLLEAMSDPTVAQGMAAEGPPLGPQIFAGFGAQGLAALLVTPFVTGVVTVLAARAHLGERVSAPDGLRTAGRRYFPLVIANLLIYLAVGGLAAVMIVPVILVFFLGAATEPVVGILVGLTLALLALVVGAAVLVLFLVATPVIVIERRGPFAALARSASLVRRRFWPVVGVGLLTWLISTLIASVFVWPFSVPAMLLGGQTAFVLTTLGTIVGTVIVTPLLPNAHTLIYYDLRVRAEGLDLEHMAAALDDHPGGRPA